MRAICASALARRYLLGKDVSPQEIRTPGQDARSDVRAALGVTLRDVGEAAPERLLPLMDHWLKAKSPRLRHTALLFIPILAESHADAIIRHIHPLAVDDDRDVRAALVDALQTLAEHGMAPAVLELFSHWSASPTPNVWVITRTLSHAWAVEYPQEIESILRALQSSLESEKAIHQTLEALARRGVHINL